MKDGNSEEANSGIINSSEISPIHIKDVRAITSNNSDNEYIPKPKSKLSIKKNT